MDQETGEVLQIETDPDTYCWDSIGAHKAPYSGRIEQQWFWDGAALRSADEPEKALIWQFGRYHLDEFYPSKTLLEGFDPSKGQMFIVEDNLLIPMACLEFPNCRQSEKFFVLGTPREYFRITSKVNSKVLGFDEADKGLIVRAEDYSDDKDSQLWFWDRDLIRSKLSPDLVLGVRHSLKAASLENSEIEDSLEETTSMPTTKTEVVLMPFNNEASQRWRFEGQKLKCQFDNLTLQLEEDNGITTSQPNTSLSQQWSLNTNDRVYFSIVGKESAKVMTAISSESVALRTYQGNDNQAWFWDEMSIRSKAHPGNVLDLHMYNYEKNGKGNVYLHSYNGGDNQCWQFANESLVTSYKNLHLDIKGSRVFGRPAEHTLSQMWSMGRPKPINDTLSNGLEYLVAGQPDGILSQQWNVHNSTQLYFTIMNKDSAKVLTASSSDSVELQTYQGKDEQFWFWDEELLRSQAYPDKVLDLNMYNYEEKGRGNVYLHSYNGGDNQCWQFANESLVSDYKNLHLEIQGSEVVGRRAEAKSSQMWYMLKREQIYFTLSNKQDNKVACTDGHAVTVCDFQVFDSQHEWFWEGDAIRSRDYPDMVMDFHVADYESTGWGKVYLNRYYATDSQRWKHAGFNIVSHYQGLLLDVRGDQVGVQKNNSLSYLSWQFNHPKQHANLAIREDRSDPSVNSAEAIRWNPFGGSLWNQDSSLEQDVDHYNSLAEEIANLWRHFGLEAEQA